ETEVDHLRQALSLAESGRGQFVAIVGEPGVGKSRLTWEFTHSADAVPWLLLEGGSVSYGKATAFLPIVTLLTGCFGIEPSDDGEAVPDKVFARVLALDAQLQPPLPALFSLL